jgi:hypothetical protein
MAYCNVRTTLELDDDLVNALVTVYPGLSRTEAIETAIREHLRTSAAKQLRERAGSFHVEDTSQELRSVDRHT